MFKPRFISFINMIFGRQNFMRKVAVICNKNKARCVSVKSAGREKIFLFKFRRNKINYGFFFIVSCGADNALRLIEHYINILFKN